MRPFSILLLALLVLAGEASAQEQQPPTAVLRLAPPDRLLDSLLRAQPGAFDSVLARADQYELQIIYTQIDRAPDNTPTFTQHSWHVDPQRYFNPASLVKLPTAIAALEKVRQYADQGVEATTPMATGVAHRCQTPVAKPRHRDPDRVASVANYVKRMLLVSDNEAYNRLYEFVGQRRLNARLAEWQMPTARIVTRFAPGCDSLSNRFTNPIVFYPTGRPAVHQPAAFNTDSLLPPFGRIRKGAGYLKGGKLVKRPFDFTHANHLSLQHVTDLLRTLLFPGSGPRLELSGADRDLLVRHLGHTPHGSNMSLYRSSGYFDAYKKYLFYGRDPKRPVPGAGEPLSFNIVGLSYGYMADCAYLVDPASGTEFLLSAVIYLNQDGILNDGQYEYSKVGWPFLAWLGQTVFEFDKKRPRLNRPDLSEFSQLTRPR